MTRPSRSRALALTIAVLVTVTGLVAGAEPAGAVQRPVITLSPGQTVVTKYPALVGPNYQQGRRPASCSASSRISCDTIPVTLEISKEALDAEPSNYLMIVETNWNVRATQTVPAVGTPSDDQLNTFIYTDPPRVIDGTITEETSAFLSPPPTVLSIAPVTSTAYLITVENMVGYNDGYTLSVSFYYVGGDAPVDMSVDRPFDFSDTESFEETPSFNDLSPTSFDTVTSSAIDFGDLAGSDAALSDVTGGRTFNLNLAELQADSELDLLEGVDNASVLKLQETQEIENIASGGPPPIRDASGMWLAVWLVILPLLAAGAVFVVAYRRRAVVAGVS